MESSFRPVKAPRTFEAAVAQIADLIVHGELRRGDRLPSERSLATEMEISRPTVRAALRALSESGVLELQPGPGGGAWVRSEYVPHDVLQGRAALRLGEVSGVLEARRLLEPRVAQLAALHGRARDFETMARTIERQEEVARRSDPCPPPAESPLQLDLEFHLSMARATGNETILEFMRSLIQRLEIVRKMAWHEPPVPAWAIDIHLRTLAAIRSGDVDRIDAVMDEHLRPLEDVWQRETGHSLTREVPDFLRPT